MILCLRVHLNFNITRSVHKYLKNICLVAKSKYLCSGQRWQLCLIAVCLYMYVLHGYICLYRACGQRALLLQI